MTTRGGVGVGRGVDCAGKRGTTTGVGVGFAFVVLRRVRVRRVCAPARGSAQNVKADRRTAVRNLLVVSGKPNATAILLELFARRERVRRRTRSRH
jgi:hypothetical protein